MPRKMRELKSAALPAGFGAGFGSGAFQFLKVIVPGLRNQIPNNAVDDYMKSAAEPQSHPSAGGWNRSIGSSSPKANMRFGLERQGFSSVEELAEDLPWDLRFGDLSPEEVGDAKGAVTKLAEQKKHWEQYAKAQSAAFELNEEIYGKKVELAKTALSSRVKIAELDKKLRVYGEKHQTDMSILELETSNNEKLEAEILELRKTLEGNRFSNASSYQNLDYTERTGYENTSDKRKKMSMVERYQARRDAASNPNSSENAPEYPPSENSNVYQFRRRAS